MRLPPFDAPEVILPCKQDSACPIYPKNLKKYRMIYSIEFCALCYLRKYELSNFRRAGGPRGKYRPNCRAVHTFHRETPPVRLTSLLLPARLAKI